MLRHCRLVAALCAVTGAAAALLFAPAARADHPLEPDLKTLRLSQSDLVMEARANRDVLRLTNVVANKGVGPLEIRTGETSTDCDADGDPTNDVPGYQRVFADAHPPSGVYEPATDTAFTDAGIGCVQYHAKHTHWHVLGFASYELFREQTGAQVGESRKVGFCVFDLVQPFPELAGSPESSVYDGSGCGAFGGELPEGGLLEGLSVGYADVYGYNLAGQGIDVTGAQPGVYCLASSADPGDTIDEVRDDNNLRDVRIMLDPDALEVDRLRGPCQLSG